MICGMNGIQHIGIPITDTVKAIRFYESLGFRELMYSSYENENGNGKCWMLGYKNTIVELYLVPEAEMEEINSRKDGHIDHIAFDVDNIDEAFHSAINMGLDIVEPSPVQLNYWEKGCRYFNIIGPSGERLEFCEILK